MAHQLNICHPHEIFANGHQNIDEMMVIPQYETRVYPSVRRDKLVSTILSACTLCLNDSHDTGKMNYE